MTDWSTFKVTELKEELKSRGVPLTGLKLKQQLVDKLAELDAQQAQSDAPRDDAAEEEPVVDDVAKDATDWSEPVQEDDSNEDEGKQFIAQASEQLDPPKIDTKVPSVQDIQPPTGGERDHVKGKPPSDTLTVFEGISALSQVPAEEFTRVDIIENSPTPVSKLEPEIARSEPQPPSIPTLDQHAEATISGSPSSAVSATEVVEDSKKRKRRSITPPPSTAEVALKRARARDGTPVPTKLESHALGEIQKATNEAEDIRTGDGDAGPPNPTPPPGAESTLESGNARESPLHRASSSQRPGSPTKLWNVAPARHVPTRALYIRNFKRPLNLLTLRQYVTALSKTPPGNVIREAEDPVESFYLDGIRTHAFISFSSIPAAKAVRQAMHNTLFPDEPGRDPLYVDYVPAQQLNSWIQTENDQGPRARFEVVYEDIPDGAVAIHQEVRIGRQQPQSARPTMSQSTTSPSVPQTTSIPARPSFGGAIHPSRAALVPQEPGVRSKSSDQAKASSQSGSTGTGFKALDELFSSTRNAKPKLYFKPVSQNIVDDRMKMIRELRVGHAEMGRSGDEGMKRYSLEVDRVREEWIDKGPEFGFGRKGADRLVGRSVRGSGRPYHSGPRFERINDTWR